MKFQTFLQEQKIQIRKGAIGLTGTVPLTGSKSESNRALLIHKLSAGRVNVLNLSAADDTRLMGRALELLEQPESAGSADQKRTESSVTTIDIGPAGTVMRFMTALLSITQGQFILTGSERMQLRPIGLLVGALQQLGANIAYVEKSGYPPLAIKGGFEQKTEEVEIAGDVSSQYLSALLLIAPVLPQGLRLKIKGQLTSRPYLTMTLDMLVQAGIVHDWQDDTIYIAPQKFRATTLSVEPDWSAASYWYSLLALSESGELLLPGLRANSLQGDRAIAEIMVHFGIHSTFTPEGLLIKKQGKPTTEKITLDFTECPDLAQTIIACAAALKMELIFTGLHTLRIKETDRIAALQQEIAKFGVRLIDKDPYYYLETEDWHLPDQLIFDTYEDHRMAMAFAPLAQTFSKITIKNPRVVEKSYPDFWVHLQSMGSKIN